MANSKEVKRADFKFKPFSKKQMRLMTFWQKDSPLKNTFMTIADGSIRSGKEQPHDARIYTPEGYKTMGEIKVGDYVLTREGKPTKVIGKFPQGEKDIYKITFNDGSSTECGLDHLWTYSRHTNPNKPSYITTSTLRELIDNPKAKRYLFPMVKPLEFNKRMVENPFLIGAILSAGRKIGEDLYIITEEREVHNKLTKLLPNYTPEYKLGLGKGKVPQVNISEDIIYTSIETRKKILEGAIKAKGVTWDSIIRIVFTNKEYANIIIDIARSLGYFVKRNKYAEDWVCEIYVTPELTKLMTEIQVKDITQYMNKTSRLIKSIEKVGRKECSCIMIEDKEHLYITDNYIVTHNTVAMTFSFCLFLMNTFYDANAAICGKSIGTIRRNVIPVLKQMMEAIGYTVIDHRSENYLEIKMDDITNYVYLFGASNESSQDLIQGSDAAYSRNIINN